MTVGTKSILFGVHQFIWHPLTVGLAWKALYGKRPRWHEVVAIFCHDLGYWGCPDMDGEQGQRHPIRGADLTYRTVYRLRRIYLNLRFLAFLDDVSRDDDSFELAESARRLSQGHSRYYAKRAGIPVSPLFKADKASIYFDPKWWYLLRAHASGEIWEFKANTGVRLPDGATTGDWYSWYVKKVGELL